MNDFEHKHFESDTLGKRVIELVTIVGVLAFLAFCWWVVAEHVTFNPKEWSMFFNYRLPLLISQIGPIVGFLIIFDAMYKGWTIQAIMYIHKNSPWQDKAVAAAFVGWLSYVIMLATKGS